MAIRGQISIQSEQVNWTEWNVGFGMVFQKRYSVVLRAQDIYHALAISWWLIVSICIWGEHPIANVLLATYHCQMIQYGVLPTCHED